MKNKLTFASMITCLLLMASSIAFSQDSSGQEKKPVPASTNAMIERVIPNLAHHTISVVLANLDPKGDYSILLYNSGKELINTYWVDGNELSLFVGSIEPNNYELVLVDRKKVVDRKEMLLQ